MTHFRTIWISDIHLGTKQCKAEMLLDFIKNNTCEKLYLVGDIIDFWALKNKIYWPSTHNTIIQKILRLSRKGVDVRYVLGNHDEALRPFIEEHSLNIGEIKILKHDYHYTQNGKKILVIHGDQYDGAIRSMGWVYWVGDRAYDLALFTNNFYNWFRKLFGYEYWSLSAYLKNKVKDAIKFIGDFEKMVSISAKEHQVFAVLCGHIHHPQMRFIDDILYINDSDWVESCCAVVEDFNGNLSIIKHDGTVIFSYVNGKLKE